MKLIDVHVHLFPEDVVDEYMENYSSHSKLHAVCRPTLDTLFKEYGGVDVERFVILQEWESTKPFVSDNLKPAAESDRFYTRCYFYYFNKWLGKIQTEHENLACFGGVHPDDLQHCLDYSAGKFDLRQEFTLEYRLRRHDGEYCRVSDTGVPRFSADGSFTGYVGWCFDIDEPKRAGEAISTVNARLIEAQERELITNALRETRGNQTRAAKLLGTTKRIIQYRIRKMGIDPRPFRTKTADTPRPSPQEC